MTAEQFFDEAIFFFWRVCKQTKGETGDVHLTIRDGKLIAYGPKMADFSDMVTMDLPFPREGKA